MGIFVTFFVRVGKCKFERLVLAEAEAGGGWGLGFEAADGVEGGGGVLVVVFGSNPVGGTSGRRNPYFIYLSWKSASKKRLTCRSSGRCCTASLRQ